MNLNIKKITVLRRKYSTDIVFIQTDLPNPYIAACGYEEPLKLQFETSAETAEEYVRKNFNREPDEVISI